MYIIVHIYKTMSLKLQTDAYRMNKNVNILYLAVTNFTAVRTGTLIFLNNNYKNATDAY